MLIQTEHVKFLLEIKSDDQLLNSRKPDHFDLEHKHTIFRKFFGAYRMQAKYGVYEVKKWSP